MPALGKGRTAPDFKLKLARRQAFFAAGRTGARSGRSGLLQDFLPNLPIRPAFL